MSVGHADDRVSVALRPLTGQRWQRMVPPALVAGGLTAATVALHLRDPHVEGSWGACPTAAMGFWCPGCGGLRAVNLLSNLDPLAAASSNLALIVAIPVLGYVFARWSLGRWQGRSWQPSHTAMNVSAAGVVLGLAIFTLVRNLPAGAWLAP